MTAVVERTFILVIKELIQFRRDWVLAAFILLAPVLQLILMARTVERGIAEQPVVVLDRDRSRLARQLIVDLDNTEELHVAYMVQTTAEVDRLLDQGSARLAVVIPAGLSRELEKGYYPQQIQVIADGSNTMAASVTMSAAAKTVARLSADLARDRGWTLPEWIELRTDVRFNPEMDFRDYSIPAQLGFITYQVTLAVAALGLARERELGTLEQLMVTPLRRIELTLGKGIPALAVGAVNFSAMWAICLGVFHVPMNGSVPLLAALTMLFVATVVSWGLVLSAISRTQQQAILLVFILAMVEMAFSGFLVPVKNMPALLQTLSLFAPLQHYLVIIRSIMLKGAGLRELWPQAVALVALCLAMGGIARRMIARTVE